MSQGIDRKGLSRDGEWKAERVTGTTGGFMSRDVTRQPEERRAVTVTDPM